VLGAGGMTVVLAKAGTTAEVVVAAGLVVTGTLAGGT